MFDIKLTEHLAQLSKIEFTESELAEISSQMTDIIAVMDTVKDFDKNERPFAPEAAVYSQLRCDEPEESFETSEILKNAKQVRNNSFVVPKVVS